MYEQSLEDPAVPVICGIDPSLTSTAVCFGCSEERWESRRFQSKNQGSGVVSRMKRIDNLVERVNDLLEEVAPAIILIENYSYGSRNNRELLGELGGILRWHLIDHTVHVFEVAPMTLKKFVTGKGKGQKQMMIAHVQKRWDQIFESDDEVDAFGLYQLGLRCAGVLKPTNQAERDTVKTVLGDLDADQLKEEVHG